MRCLIIYSSPYACSVIRMEICSIFEITADKDRHSSLYQETNNKNVQMNACYTVNSLMCYNASVASWRSMSFSGAKINSILTQQRCVILEFRRFNKATSDTGVLHGCMCAPGMIFTSIRSQKTERDRTVRFPRHTSLLIELHLLLGTLGELSRLRLNLECFKV